MKSFKMEEFCNLKKSEILLDLPEVKISNDYCLIEWLLKNQESFASKLLFYAKHYL